MQQNRQPTTWPDPAAWLAYPLILSGGWWALLNLTEPYRSQRHAGPGQCSGAGHPRPLLANALPQQNRAWGFTLAFVASQAGQALALAGMGQAFNAWFGAFPIFLLLANAVQLALAFRLWNLDKPSHGGG